MRDWQRPEPDDDILFNWAVSAALVGFGAFIVWVVVTYGGLE